MLEDSTRSKDCLEGNGNEILKFVLCNIGLFIGSDGKFVLEIRPCRDCDCVEAIVIICFKLGALSLFSKCVMVMIFGQGLKVRKIRFIGE